MLTESSKTCVDTNELIERLYERECESPSDPWLYYPVSFWDNSDDLPAQDLNVFIDAVKTGVVIAQHRATMDVDRLPSTHPAMKDVGLVWVTIEPTEAGEIARHGPDRIFLLNGYGSRSNAKLRFKLDERVRGELKRHSKLDISQSEASFLAAVDSQHRYVSLHELSTKKPEIREKFERFWSEGNHKPGRDTLREQRDSLLERKFLAEKFPSTTGSQSRGGFKVTPLGRRALTRANAEYVVDQKTT